MVLVRCNHCNKEVNNKKDNCLWCGKPLSKELKDIKEEVTEEDTLTEEPVKKVREKFMQLKIWTCKNCNTENDYGLYSCLKCQKISQEELMRIEKDILKNFNYNSSYKLMIWGLTILGFFLGILLSTVLIALLEIIGLGDAQGAVPVVWFMTAIATYHLSKSFLQNKLAKKLGYENNMLENIYKKMNKESFKKNSSYR